jgi:hypothetical protein
MDDNKDIRLRRVKMCRTLFDGMKYESPRSPTFVVARQRSSRSTSPGGIFIDVQHNHEDFLLASIKSKVASQIPTNRRCTHWASTTSQCRCLNRLVRAEVGGSGSHIQSTQHSAVNAWRKSKLEAELECRSICQISCIEISVRLPPPGCHSAASPSFQYLHFLLASRSDGIPTWASLETWY